MRTGAAVEDVGPLSVSIAKRKEPMELVIWAGGVFASPLARQLSETDQAGRITVDETLAVGGQEIVFALGDAATPKFAQSARADPRVWIVRRFRRRVARVVGLSPAERAGRASEDGERCSVTRYLHFLRAQWDAVRTSFWFVPALMGLAAITMAVVAPAVDGAIDGEEHWLVYVGAQSDARDIVGTLLASMITMTSLVFSITMVVLTLAASQFGPRLVRNFMASRRTQLVFGTYVMTISFSLLLYGSIGWRQGEGPFPYVSVSLAIGLTLLSVAFLILHVHGLARSLVSETVIELVGRELDDGILNLEPLEEGIGEDPEAALPADFEEKADFCGLRRGGYVQAIEFDELIGAARAADVFVGLRFQAGDYVVEGGRDIAIYPADRVGPELRDAIARAFTIGPNRTPVQDLEFSIRHLVEIAVRALSPGINDPYTAVAVIDRLSASLARLMHMALPAGVLKDETGEVRVICERPTYGSLIGAALHQIRQNGGDKPLVLIHLLAAISRTAAHVRTESQRDALEDELREVSETARREVDDPADLASVEQHVRAASKALRESKRLI